MVAPATVADAAVQYWMRVVMNEMIKSAVHRAIAVCCFLKVCPRIVMTVLCRSGDVVHLPSSRCA